MPEPDTQLEPRWPAILAILTAGLVYLALPEYLSIGPRWMLILLVSVLEIPTVLSHRRGHYQANRVLGFIISGIITIFLLWSLGMLIVAIPQHKEDPIEMLRSAGILWISNVINFAVWYWRLDGGGPGGRDRRRADGQAHVDGAFLFPQMAFDPTRCTWSPRFVDYLFLSFNTSTALSPTDAAILSRWAKGLVMLQSTISLAIVVLLAARAVNIM